MKNFMITSGFSIPGCLLFISLPLLTLPYRRQKNSRIRAVEQHQHLGCVLCSLMYCYVAARAKARPQAILVFRRIILHLRQSIIS